VVCCLLYPSSLALAATPAVISAIVNTATIPPQVTISGNNLTPVTGAPAVNLDATGLILVSYTNTQIVAKLPSGLPAGSFRLSVNNGGATPGIFDVTIGTVGPQGPAGPQGPPGTVTLPFSGTGGTTSTALFSIMNTSGNGVYAHGGTGQTVGAIGLDAVGGNGAAGAAVGNGGAGVFAQGGTSTGPDGDGGDGIDAFGQAPGGAGIYAASSGGAAGFFSGYAYVTSDLYVEGNLTKASGSFKIDHPLDPANKYLYHSFVESPDMMNIYNGNVVTDGSGAAVVQMPAWFEALNTDFRYQLTVIGQFAQAIVASEIANRSFVIRTNKPNVKVSWQVTGIRQDAWANAHRIQVEVEKAPPDQGRYIHPELFGHEGEASIAEMHHRRPQPPLR
jgi:hypothetical protein